MWTVSNKRCLQLQNKGGYYNTNTNFIRNLVLPMRYDCEDLDYSLDISTFLQDSFDRIRFVSAKQEGMELLWLSYAHECILFSLGKGSPEKVGILYCYAQTFGGRSFQITLTQSIEMGNFARRDPPPDFIPNLIQLPNTQPLRSSDEAFFFFG
ncbi:hypothetical protein [Commensalibacter papalotli (ex Botero et al. 2024)]|uniref:hypothetical protein n=1 Tax=Commensalibacter papalotli (ex Botero et al. 2024) TaxID=2972766 RepID=UPI0022FF9FF0|nr:hypothetical protein [Commensalibacter papalotli (ex Botero et al. 2024)]CAI3945759.1 unnamed protein product [Commensalibacter papalotli (ex Botero et al. 2024)]